MKFPFATQLAGNMGCCLGFWGWEQEKKAALYVFFQRKEGKKGEKMAVSRGVHLHRPWRGWC